MPAKAILPKRALVEPAKLARALQNTLDAQARNIQIDFQVTVRTWQHAVDFLISAPNPYTREIATADGIYAMVNDGTRPHPIRPRRGKVLAFKGGFRAKTLPRTIGSGAGGSSGPEVFSRGVNHPGTAARDFDTTIAQKWDRLLGPIFQRAIDAEFG